MFSTVSVVGAGPAGCGIAIACAAEGLPVTLVTSSRSARIQPEVLRERVLRRLALSVEHGGVAQAERDAIAARIVVTGDLSHVADADLVIDSTRCDPRTRRAMLATLESRLSGGAVLATGASPEQLSEIAQVIRRPDQLVGMRIAVPAANDIQIEITFLPETAPGVIAACRGFVALLRQTALEQAGAPSRVGYREWHTVPPPASSAAE